MKKWILAVVLLSVFVLTGCTDHIENGLDALKAENYKEAKESFKEEIKKGKNLDEAYRGLGIACYELNEYEVAIHAFEQALKNEAEETATLYNMLGVCHMQMGEYKKALDVYQKALTVKTIAKETKQEIQYNLIVVYEKMLDWDAAKEQMRLYREAYPDDERVKKESDFLETR